MVDESGIEPDPRIGCLVDDRYKVHGAMASGSMGVVYKAERVPVGKLVAIKFLHAPFANDSEFLARFERETRVMSKLNHPNCVSVVDFGVWDGAPYLVMEYVSGTTLRALIDNGALPPRRALALARQIAAGLAHAHAQGVVHRDVKPANIMISEEIGTGDHVRILDFGLARLRGSVGRDATQSNVVVGTPNYMAPEQTVGGGLIDARTDIYAAGVVLFEMVSGERPFQADDTLALLGMHRAAPIPRLAEVMPAGAVLPHGLQDIVDTAMAKSPGDRFQSAIEFAEAIDQVANDRAANDRADAPVEPVIRRDANARRSAGLAPTMLDVSDAGELSLPPPRRRRRSSGTLIALLLLTGVVGAAVWWGKGRSGSRAPAPGAASGAASGAAADRPGSGSAAAPASPAAPAPASGSAASPATTGSSAVGLAPAGSASPAATGRGVAEPTAAAPDTAEPPAGSATEAGSGSQATEAPADVAAGSAAAAEIEMDPTKAEDPSPASTRPSNDADEVANAPATAEEVERHARTTPAASGLATTLEGAVQLIQADKRELALASLLALWKKTPASAYIPFLLGNLYYDKLWWAVAMDHYAAAIKKNGQYRSNPTLNRNVIRMLGSSKTSRKAQGFLRYTIGRPAIPHLRNAAQHDESTQVRRLAGGLVRAF